MADIETSGIVIVVHESKRGAEVYNLMAIDVFTVDYGILRWFFKKNNKPLLREIMFAEVEIVGNLINDTCGIINSLVICNINEKLLYKNNSYQHAVSFVRILRNIVFDGVAIPYLLAILYKFIQNLKKGLNPELVLFKALYLTSKCEGYAVDQDWLCSLSADIQYYVKSLLSARENVVTDQNIQDLINVLENWMLSQV